MNTAQDRNWAYFVPLVALPAVISGPGAYVTRSGETVFVTQASRHNDFGCTGHYASGQSDHWHRSGRLFAGCESDNDIVQPHVEVSA